jgi:hypothetical protein
LTELIELNEGDALRCKRAGCGMTAERGGPSRGSLKLEKGWADLQPLPAFGAAAAETAALRHTAGLCNFVTFVTMQQT